MLEGCVPWPSEFVKRYVNEGYWMEITLAEMLEQVAQKVPEKEALIYGERRITYKEMVTKIKRLALHFLALGLKPCDRVVFQLPNSPEFVYTFCFS